MERAIFDTERVAQRLRQSGVPEPMVEGMVEAFRIAMADVATKEDLQQMETRLESKMNRILLQGLLAFATLQILSVGILARILSG